MRISDTVARSAASNQAGGRERLASPAIIQSGRAVRHATGSGLRRACVKTTPGAVTAYEAYLDTDEIGDIISVNCDIAGSGYLNSVIPRLADGTWTTVYQIDSAWHCATTFQASEDCDCYTTP